MEPETARLMKIIDGSSATPTLEDQLAALESLAKIGGKEVLDFLERAYTPTIEEVSDERSHQYSGDPQPFSTYSRDRCYDYINVGHPLRGKLDYHVNMLKTQWYDEFLRDEADIERDAQRELDENEYHQLFKSAIINLILNFSKKIFKRQSAKIVA
jgi:hypothetical protein